MHRYTALLTIILFSSCVTQPVGKDVSVPGAPPKIVLIEIASQVEKKPYSAEELANPMVKSVIAQCESQVGGEGCRKRFVITKYLTQFVRTKDEKIFVFVALGGVETDREYKTVCRWFDPDGDIIARMTITAHGPSDFPPGATLDYRFVLNRSSESPSLKLGKWRVEISVNGKIEGARTFEVVDVQSRSEGEEIAQDGQFVAHKNGIVEDAKTGLEWVTGPDRDTTWDEAKAWVEDLTINGGGWRMPTMAELRSIYKDGVGTRNMDPKFKTTGWWIWSGDKTDLSSAWAFAFNTGNEYWYSCEKSHNGRVFAVRFLK